MLLWTLLAVLGHPEDYSRNYTHHHQKHHHEEPSRNATHYEENHRNTTRSVRKIKCLRGCPDKALDFHDPEMVCLWWQVEGEHNPNSCFEDCSDRVLRFMEHKIHRACEEFEMMYGQIYLQNGSTTESYNTTQAQDNEQHYHEDYRNTTSNDTESHHEHKKHDHDHKEHDHHHHHEEHEHEEDHKHDMPECLKDCPFENVNFTNPESVCPWWHAEGPEHNADSCFLDCSPGVMHHIVHHIEQVCTGKPEENPFDCVEDCPVEGLDPHSAESFCPWFSATKNSACFYDCSDEFLNMAQAHAEHTCANYTVEGAAKFTTYINEPLVDELVAAEEPMRCAGGFYQIAGYECQVCPAAMYSYEGDYECSACAEGLTSFPGAMSPEECFKRH